MILAACRRRLHNRNIHALYGMIVAQARSRAFYADYGVPDTVEGRFELIVLHLVLLLRRLARTDQAGGRGNSYGSSYSTRFAVTSMTICAKWASATRRCRVK